MRNVDPVQLVGVCLTLLCSAAMSCVPGCSMSSSSSSVELGGDEGSPSPIDSASTRGLEVRLMVVDDTQWSAARSLLPFVQSDVDDEGHADQPGFQQWADWGFRFVRVPIGEIQGVLDSLRAVQPISNQWLGEFGQWRPVVRAGALRASQVRVGDDSSRPIERGRPRLIARSWIEPMFSQRDVIPAVRIDLAMQIETKKRQEASVVFQPSRQRMIEDEGPVLDELMLSTMLDGTHALVLVGEAPGFDWEALPESSDLVETALDETALDHATAFGPGEDVDQPNTQGQETLSPPGSADTTGATGASQPKIEPGPPQPKGQSLGEIMLTSKGSRIERLDQARVIPKRVVVVFIPRVAGGYGLIPRVAGRAGGD